jgi:hypothetical protein
LAADDKDLDIMLLRQQRRIVERKHPVVHPFPAGRKYPWPRWRCASKAKARTLVRSSRRVSSFSRQKRSSVGVKQTGV